MSPLGPCEDCGALMHRDPSGEPTCTECVAVGDPIKALIAQARSHTRKPKDQRQSRPPTRQPRRNP